MSETEPKLITPEMAAQEILFRQSARENLIDFARYTQKTYEADPFHYLLAEYLEKVERGEIDRLMINTPPRHGKSELASIKFPAWFMARNPHNNIIQASYNLDQATRSSRFTRDIIEGDYFARVFPEIKMSPQSRAADRWMLDSGQEYFAVGVGTGATGKGGHIFIIDDPHKDSEEADSPVMREKVWDWYNSVVYTRLERGGRVIVIQTRWHYDDLSGRLLQNAQKGGDKWVELNLPALCTDPETDLMGRKEGEALSPGRKNEKELQRIQENLSPRFWSAMFQQKPVADEGALFNPSWFEETTRIPLGVKRVRAWDFGSTQDGDYTVGVLMARDRDGVFYVEDVVRDRMSPMEVERTVMRVAESDRKHYGNVQIIIPQDPAQAGVAQVQSYMRRMAGFRIKAVRPTGDKETRASGFAAQAESGMVKLRAKGTWHKAYLEELSMFPLGKYDDQVDATSDAFNGLLGPGQAKILDW